MNKFLSIAQATTAGGGVICGLSLIELNALLGIILTITSFLLLVIPKCIGLVKKLKNSLKDGVIDDEELNDIKNTCEDIRNDLKKVEESLNDRKENKND